MKKYLVATLFFVLFAVLPLYGCGGESNANTETPSSSGQSKEVTATTEKKNTTPLTKQEIAYVYGGSLDYEDRIIEITGKVFTAPDTSDGATVFQLYADPTNNERNTIVGFKEGAFSVSQNNYLRITGIVCEPLEYANAIGATITAPMIAATSIEVVSYADVAAPTLKEVSPASAIDQNGYIVKVDNIEFAENETRVYVTVVNGGSGNFSLYSFNSKLIQSGQQYEEQSNYQADYPKIVTDLVPGVTTTGIICFPEIEQGSFQLQFEAYSDNWKEDISTYIFDIAV